jgi:hypothetical protein
MGGNRGGTGGCGFTVGARDLVGYMLRPNCPGFGSAGLFASPLRLGTLLHFKTWSFDPTLNLEPAAEPGSEQQCSTVACCLAI